MIAFRELWYRHPANNALSQPCVASRTLVNMEGKTIQPGYPVFGNQCAIRMGVCLKNVGFTLNDIRVQTCGVHPPEEMHFIRAQELADALARTPLAGIGKIERIVGRDVNDFYAKLFGRTGLIYIKDYWRRHGETSATGDHIDVWNGYRPSTKWLMEWFSWLGYHSNYVEAKEIWFWEVR